MGRVLVIGEHGTVGPTLRDSASLRGHAVHMCSGAVEALQELRNRAFDVVLTDPATPMSEDLALSRELSHVRPGIRIIALAPAVAHEDLIAALRAHVFACFTSPFDRNEIVDMVGAALNASRWNDGIAVVSGLPHWFTLRVSCQLLTADRLVRFMTEHLTAMPKGERDLLIAAFREMLMNAMEHGAAFDSEKVIEVTAARTSRAIVYHFHDPGGGFDRTDLKHAAKSPEPGEVVSSALRRAELGLRPGGFGMLIARQVADELVYNEAGNEALLIKYLT